MIALVPCHAQNTVHTVEALGDRRCNLAGLATVNLLGCGVFRGRR